MPSPSYWPRGGAVRLPLIGGGAVVKEVALVIPGTIISLYGVTAWVLEPVTEEE